MKFKIAKENEGELIVIYWSAWKVEIISNNSFIQSVSISKRNIIMNASCFFFFFFIDFIKYFKNFLRFY